MRGNSDRGALPLCPFPYTIAEGFGKGGKYGTYLGAVENDLYRE